MDEKILAELKSWQRWRRQKVWVVAVQCTDKKMAKAVLHLVMEATETKIFCYPRMTRITRARASAMTLIDPGIGTDKESRPAPVPEQRAPKLHEEE